MKGSYLMMERLFPKLVAYVIYLIALCGGMIFGLSLTTLTSNNFNSLYTSIRDYSPGGFVAANIALCVVLIILFVLLILRTPYTKVEQVNSKLLVSVVINSFIAGLFSALVYRSVGNILITIFFYL